MSKKTELMAGIASASALLATAASAADLAAAAASDDASSDWSGLYLGISVGTQTGLMPMTPGSDEFDPAVNEYSLAPGMVPGGFVGINEQMGSIVLGAELAVQGATPVDEGPSYDEYNITASIDVKARAGLALDQILVYGFAGASTQYVSISSGDESYVSYGVNYGVGADVMLGDNLSVGLEYAQRSMTGWNDDDDADTFKSTQQQATLRASYHF